MLLFCWYFLKSLFLFPCLMERFHFANKRRHFGMCADFKMNISFCMIEENEINKEIVIDCDRKLSPYLFQTPNLSNKCFSSNHKVSHPNYFNASFALYWFLKRVLSIRKILCSNLFHLEYKIFPKVMILFKSQRNVSSCW